MAGIKEVAERAGVSTATASRALSGRGHVSPAARERVLSAAKDLGYVMSYAASSLASGRSRTVGVIVPFINSWFFSELLEGITSALMSEGYDLSLYSFDRQGQRQRVLADYLLRKRLDAVVAASLRLDESELKQLLDVGKPIVEIGGLVPGVPSIHLDEHAVARFATEHLIGLGHRQIAHLGGTAETGPDYFPMSTDRREGFYAALRDAECEISPRWDLNADYTVADGYRKVKTLLAGPGPRPTALFCSSDAMAVGAILAARDLGFTVPGDLSVIGIDGNPIGEAVGLTTIAQFPARQGSQAAEILLEHLAAGERPMAPQSVVVETDFIVRSSTAVPASR
ncbi:LacI family DNA-binding transcriptional regulator [Hoyosella altamirensis]|uniref:DNA-binding LacI/PurR family transcriptional regulator n=1 Tax=Hoyosella altamirensis TaxID=616997 RepID=A0A839RQZ1_9ACTN|nr:LacI family DNA-binding transcriptional regulator [Hoyosella altamirensis]MBB3038516.1 DNA-binding LacI/PurR family transcriptional regulator [Hoyosella altamirensis]